MCCLRRPRLWYIINPLFPNNPCNHVPNTSGYGGFYVAPNYTSYSSYASQASHTPYFNVKLLNTIAYNDRTGCRGNSRCNRCGPRMVSFSNYGMSTAYQLGTFNC